MQVLYVFSLLQLHDLIFHMLKLDLRLQISVLLETLGYIRAWCFTHMINNAGSVQSPLGDMVTLL